MSECICNSCMNLKGIMDDTGAVEQYECEFGYPSEKCEDCDGEGCDVTCEKYECDDLEMPLKVKCAKCGKELDQLCGDAGEGETYCTGCYLNS